MRSKANEIGMDEGITLESAEERPESLRPEEDSVRGAVIGHREVDQTASDLTTHNAESCDTCECLRRSTCC